METHKTDWLAILSELCIGDVFGHESWFIVGIEQHKEFYYCFIGDCSATEDDGWAKLYPESELAKKLEEERKAGKAIKPKIFVGRHHDSLNKAVIRALAEAFGYEASLPYCQDETDLRRKVSLEARKIEHELRRKESAAE